VAVEMCTSEEIKRLTFSQLCKFLYNWSMGSVVCVAVFGWQESDYVIVNPERKVIIGDCRSVFVICDCLDVARAMMQAQNIGLIWQRVAEEVPGSMPTSSGGSFGVEAVASPRNIWQNSVGGSLRRSRQTFTSAEEVLRYEEMCVDVAAAVVVTGGRTDDNMPDRSLPFTPLQFIMSPSSSWSSTSHDKPLRQDGTGAPVQGTTLSPPLSGSPLRVEGNDHVLENESNERVVFKRDKSSIRVDAGSLAHAPPRPAVPEERDAVDNMLDSCDDVVDSNDGGEIDSFADTASNGADPPIVLQARNSSDDLDSVAPLPVKPQSLRRNSIGASADGATYRRNAASSRYVLDIPQANTSGSSEQRKKVSIPRPRRFENH
ncbi:unnamed protein product, partial [Symbiodinium microadriaticum]